MNEKEKKMIAIAEAIRNWVAENREEVKEYFNSISHTPEELEQKYNPVDDLPF